MKWLSETSPLVCFNAYIWALFLLVFVKIESHSTIIYGKYTIKIICCLSNYEYI